MGKMMDIREVSREDTFHDTVLSDDGRGLDGLEAVCPGDCKVWTKMLVGGDVGNDDAALVPEGAAACGGVVHADELKKLKKRWVKTALNDDLKTAQCPVEQLDVSFGGTIYFDGFVEDMEQRHLKSG